jgi:hypothetical protein
MMMRMNRDDLDGRTREQSARSHVTNRYGTDEERKAAQQPWITSVDALDRVARTADPLWLPAHGPLVTKGDLQAALALVGPARVGVERNELVIMGHARAAGLTWAQINVLLGYDDDPTGRQAQTRFKRLNSRHPDIELPSAQDLIISLHSASDDQTSSSDAAASRSGRALYARLKLAESGTIPFIAAVLSERSDPMLATLHRPYRPNVLLAQIDLATDEDRRRFTAALEAGPDILLATYSSHRPAPVEAIRICRGCQSTDVDLRPAPGEPWFSVLTCNSCERRDHVES